MPLDLTQVIISMIGAVGSIIGIVAVALINSRMKDKQAADVIARVVQNAVGVAVEAGQGVVTRSRPAVTIPHVPEALQAPVQYALDHAGEELARFNITPERVAEKVVAQIGLAKIADPTIPTAELLPSPPSVTTKSLNEQELERHREYDRKDMA